MVVSVKTSDMCTLAYTQCNGNFKPGSCRRILICDMMLLECFQPMSCEYCSFAHPIISECFGTCDYHDFDNGDVF